MSFSIDLLTFFTTLTLLEVAFHAGLELVGPELSTCVQVVRLNLLVSPVINNVFDVLKFIDLVQFVLVLSQHLLSMEFLLSLRHVHSGEILQLYLF